MLAYPRNNDQLGATVRIEYYRIGIRGSRETDTPELIRSKALRMRGDPGFMERLAALRPPAKRRDEELLSSALDALQTERDPAPRLIARPHCTEALNPSEARLRARFATRAGR